MNKSNELRSRLPRLAAEMSESIDSALTQIRLARRAGSHCEGDVGAAWRKGLGDALVLLRGVQEAQKRFLAWCNDAVVNDPDGCGVTAEERAALLGLLEAPVDELEPDATAKGAS